MWAKSSWAKQADLQNRSRDLLHSQQAMKQPMLLHIDVDGERIVESVSLCPGYMNPGNPWEIFGWLTVSGETSTCDDQHGTHPMHPIRCVSTQGLHYTLPRFFPAAAIETALLPQRSLRIRADGSDHATVHHQTEERIINQRRNT